MCLDSLTFSTNTTDLEKNYSLLIEAIKSSKNTIFIKNTDFKYVAVSDPFAYIVGKQSAYDIIGKTDFEIFEDKSIAENCRKDDISLISGVQSISNMIKAVPDKNGQNHYETRSKKVLYDCDGNVIGIMGFSQNNEQLRLLKQHFAQEIHKFLQLSENEYYVAIVDLNEWNIVEKKTNFMYNQSEKESINLDTLLEQLLKSTTIEDTEAHIFYSNFSAEYISNIYKSGKNEIILEYLHKIPDGSAQWMQDVIHLRINPENGHLLVVIIITNIENQRRKELKLQREAETDSLTGLLNRNYIKIKCEDFLNSEGADGEHAFFMIDVDNFKRVNDTYGHNVGDAFLIELASILKSSVRHEDIVGRLGGDEFILFIKNTPNKDITKKRALQILEKVKTLTSVPSELKPTISIGISHYPENGSNMEELYVNADVALYKAKSNGKNCFEFFE